MMGQNIQRYHTKFKQYFGTKELLIPSISSHSVHRYCDSVAFLIMIDYFLDGTR